MITYNFNIIPRPDRRLDFLLKAARPVVWEDHGAQSP
jgi:hypothetical protein